MITVDDSNSFQEIGGDKIRACRPRAHVPAVFAPGEDEDGLAPGVVPGEDVGLRVADEERLLRRADALVHRFKGLAHRPYFRLAAVTPFIGAMRAIKNLLDPAPRLPDLIEHVTRDVAELLLCIDALAHAGLVGDDEDREAIFRKDPKGLQRTRDKTKFLELRDVFAVAREFVDDAVSVEEDKFHSIRW